MDWTLIGKIDQLSIKTNEVGQRLGRVHQDFMRAETRTYAKYIVYIWFIYLYSLYFWVRPTLGFPLNVNKTPDEVDYVYTVDYVYNVDDVCNVDDIYNVDDVYNADDVYNVDVCSDDDKQERNKLSSGLH